MKDEDRHSGRLVSRREVMAYLGATGAIWLTGDSLLPQWALAGTLGPSCVVRPEQTEGPYFVDERLHRSDIRSDPTDTQLRPGTPLTLQLLVSRLDASNCQPLPGRSCVSVGSERMSERCKRSSTKYGPSVCSGLTTHEGPSVPATAH